MIEYIYTQFVTPIDRVWRLPRLYIDWDCMGDWKTMYGFTRKILAFMAFILALTACAPMFIPAQDRDHLFSSDAEVQKHLDRIDASMEQLTVVRMDIAGLKSDIFSLKEAQKETSNRWNEIMLAVFVWIGVRVMEVVFGVKLAVKTKGQGD